MKLLKTNLVRCNFALMLSLLIILLSPIIWAQRSGIATPRSISTIQFNAPKMTPEEIKNLEMINQSETTLAEQLFQQGIAEAENDFSFYNVQNYNDTLQFEIYLNSSKIKKQFLIARQNGKIRYVFLVSGGTKSHPTPIGRDFPIHYKVWRNMSSIYEGKGENNMDHVSYFAESIGFHATVFGNYRKLGAPDSHGCVRLARPQARAIYALIHELPISNISVTSYGNGENPPEHEIEIVETQLAHDFNFIQTELLSKNNRGDVPFFQHKEYFRYLRGEMSSPEIEKAVKIYNKTMLDKFKIDSFKTLNIEIKSILHIPPEFDLNPEGLSQPALQAT